MAARDIGWINHSIPEPESPPKDKSPESEMDDMGAWQPGVGAKSVSLAQLTQLTRHLTYTSHAFMFIVVLLAGFSIGGFELDAIVLATLVGATLGSSAIYTLRKLFDPRLPPN